MGDRLSFSLPGSMESYEGTDESIGLFGIAGAVIRLDMHLVGAASGDDFTCDLRTATAGGGSGITFTITDGNNDGTIVTDQLAVAADETLYLRVTEAAGGVGLRGWFEFEPTGTSAVTAFLTTLARVKTDHGIDEATWDAQLNRLIQGKSAAMQSWAGRTFVDTTYTDEVHSGDGWTDTIILNHRPITGTETFVLKLDDSAVDSDDYTTDIDAGLVQIVDANTTAGTRNYKATYSAGYTSIPEDLAMACTAEVRHEFNQSHPSVTNRLGIESSADASGGGTTYVPGGFLPSTLEIMRPYRRRV